MKYLKETALASLVLAGLVGCGGDSGSSSSTTPITLSVSDAPIDDVKDVTVTFSKVALLPQGGGSPLIYDVYKTDENGNYVDENGDPLPDGADPIPLSVNLLDYQGSDALPLIENEVVPVGSYKLCVFANDGDHPTDPSYVIENDDTNRELTVKGNGACPQGVGKEDNAGVLYFNNSFNVNQQSNDFVVEFDLRRGLKNSSTFPDYTIQRTSVSLINTVETGNIEGTVALSTYDTCNGGDTTFVQSIYLYEGNVEQADMVPIGGSDEVKPVTSASVTMNEAQTDYEFSLGFIDPGTYSLGYTCTAQHDSGEDNADPVADGFEIYDVQNGVQVTVGQDSQVSF
ncbi:hypothetical protein CWO17_14925 [Vibrio sp. 10N.286.45.A3]|uniref:DUF4382 domain-containing protein n=1 Tax=unclassified Vibrio TaxID=2614977 RepID=UPI000C855A93|nr:MULTISPECIES: DUF4382 domain-containing protein [unclassified Vibrio]PMI19926.1 hypothetical protein BCU50_19165 [Vibrio sp. 10N.286.46.E10]PTO98135.1 hypothetical protein CWO08_00325 [Vibrio sp. 10N.286.48.B8]PTP02019.1 hypothetical protein CWO17_14925 [Vibrio sp. 10N.286.45.A3]TKE76035.1 DUF4382 domain-containing protein [Vibrio sp. F12]TKE90745.1 DUF4382 domain-containing protein [Vibrio sp. F12]